MGRRDQLNHVAEGALGADGGEVGERVLLDFYVLGGAADGQNLHDLLERVGQEADDEQTVEEIDGDAVRRLHVRPADVADASVGGQDDDGREVGLEGSVHVREALDVEHVHFVDEEDAGHEFGNAVVDIPVDDFV